MKCSLLVANFNHADVIPTALQSIEAQTYPDWEAVIVDDASVDNSLEVIRSFISASQHREKYRVISLARNMGVGHAKKTAAENASGEVMAICDPDDALHPEAVAKVMQEHLKQPQASLVYTSYYYCDSALRPQRVRQHAGHILHSDLKEDKVCAFAAFKSAAYHRTAGFDAAFRLAEDKDLYYKLEEVGEVVYLDEPLYYYRIWDRGISQGFDSFVRSRDYRLTAIEHAMERRKKSGIKQLSETERRHLLAAIHLLQAEGIMYSEQPVTGKFFKHWYKAVRLHPTSKLKVKAKTLLLLSRVKRSLRRLLQKK